MAPFATNEFLAEVVRKEMLRNGMLGIGFKIMLTNERTKALFELIVVG